MKLFIGLAVITVAQAAKLDRVYLPPNARASAGSASFLQTPLQPRDYQAQNDYSSAPTFNSNAYAQNAYSGFEPRNLRAQAALERNAAILRQDNSNDGETYSFAYETENGIYAEENGVATNGVQAQGGYSYTGDDGKVYSVRYTADENGFIPQGDHLPTPPPIPEEIMKALEKNAQEEAAGIYDDGSYAEAKYTAAGNTQEQYYNTNAQPINYNENSVVTNSARLRNGFNRNSVEKTYQTKQIAAGNTQQQYYNTNAQPINYNENSVVTNSERLRNGNGFNRNSVQKTYQTKQIGAGNIQDQYYNTNTQPINYNEDSVVTNSASLRSGNGFNRNSIEKTYLPPFIKRNGNYNARTGYNY